MTIPARSVIVNAPADLLTAVVSRETCLRRAEGLMDELHALLAWLDANRNRNRNRKGGTMYDDGRTVIAAARRWYQSLADYHQAVAIWHAEGGEPNMIAVHQAASRHDAAKQDLAQAVKELREFEAAQLAALDEVFGPGTAATYSLVAQLTGEA